jgi:CheY-like chemotaxis protein
MTGRVLIVEDDEDIQHYYRVLLSGMDLDIAQALTGEEALEIIDSGQEISLILLDIILPGMGGREFLRKLRAEKNSQIPVILSSVDEEFMNRLESVGKVQGMFLKGTGGGNLRRMIKEFLPDKDPSQE